MLGKGLERAIKCDFTLHWMAVWSRRCEADRWCYQALREDVTPRGMEKCSVKAVNDDARVYEDNDNEPDAVGYPKEMSVLFLATGS